MATRYAYVYTFKFELDEAGRDFHCVTYAFSFMSAYSQALEKLRKAKKAKARLYKLANMYRQYNVEV